MSAMLNITSNGTRPSNCSSASNLKAERIRTTLGYCLIAAFSLAGNSFIGIIVYKTKAMRKPINFSIVNMAISDLLHPIFIIPWLLTKVYADFSHFSYPLAQAFCKLGYFLPNVSIAVSVQSLVLIAVDRFGAVVFPLHYPPFNTKLCSFSIVATWIVAVTVLSPNLLAFKLVEYPGKLICEVQWEQIFGKTSDNRDYLLTILIFWYFIPFSLMTILYSIILLKLKSHKVLGDSSFNAKKQRLEQQRKVLRMAIAIVFGFAICWTPFCTFYVLMSFVWKKNTTDIRCGIIKLFWFIACIMAQVNNVLNPCICFIFSENYHQGLKKIIKYLGTFIERNIGRCYFILTFISPGIRKKKSYVVNNQFA